MLNQDNDWGPVTAGYPHCCAMGALPLRATPLFCIKAFLLQSGGNNQKKDI
jgi:hypothetical protein